MAVLLGAAAEEIVNNAERSSTLLVENARHASHLLRNAARADRHARWLH